MGGQVVEDGAGRAVGMIRPVGRTRSWFRRLRWWVLVPAAVVGVDLAVIVLGQVLSLIGDVASDVLARAEGGSR